MRKLLYFLAGMLVSALLARVPAVEAASQLMFGSNSGVAKAIAVTSTGAVIVSAQ